MRKIKVRFYSLIPKCGVFDIVSCPLQASVYTTAILFALSQELSRIGVHCIHRHVNFLFLVSAYLDDIFVPTI